MAVWALALHRIAPTWLAAVVAVALAGCSGAGLTPERTPSIGIVVAEPRGATNLVVVAYVSDGNPPSAAAFTLSAVVRNTGNEASAATTLHFYRSADETITTGDTEVGATAVPGLAASGGGSESLEVTAPALPGTYYYGACVDPAAGESDTTDNCSPAVPIEVAEPNAPPAAPGESGGTPPAAAARDLSASAAAVTTGSDDLTRGTPFSLSVSVTNHGNGPSRATTLGFYRSTDQTITTADMEVGSDDVPALAPSGTSVQSASLTAPSTAGTYYYGACVDAAPGDSDTTNDCSSGVSVRVREGHPSLYVGAPEVSPGAVDPGQTFTLSVRVSNSGDAAAPATTLRYYRSTDETIGSSDTAVGTAEVEALAASEGSTKSISLTAPSTAGTYYYGACVDAAPGDSDTTDDCSSAVPVRVRQGHPRVNVGVPEVNPSAVEPGTTFTLSVRVSNSGDAAAPATTLRYYRSTDRRIGRSDTEVNTAEVGSLAASGRSTESITLTAPSTVGTYYYGACVDAVPGDSDTTDDCSSGWERMAGRVEVRLPPLAPHCTDTHVIWCATLTVGVGVSGRYYGYNGSGNHLGRLAPDTFTYRGVTIEVTALKYFKDWPPFLFLLLDRNRESVPSDGLFGDETFSLELDDGTVVRSFHVSTNSPPFATEYAYYSPSLTWRRNATVSVTLSHNPVPTATGSTVTTPSDTDYAFTAADFNFMDSYGDTLRSIEIDSPPALGNLRLNRADVTAGSRVTAAQVESGNLTYTPPASQTGTALTTFTFKVNDGISDSASYTMTINVAP